MRRKMILRPREIGSRFYHQLSYESAAMNRATSLYLDLARFIAALVVFGGHVSGQRLTGGLFWQFGLYMSHAVTVFFVLSGFVIRYATDQRETTAHAYGISRAARIYSVALPALAATFVLDSIGHHIHPDYYSARWGYESTGQPLSYLLCLTFLNQIWFLHADPGSDLPYWSLGYEVWYYVIFGVFLFHAGKWRWLALGGLLIFVGPKIVSMLPLWLFGVAAYNVCARRKITCAGGLALWAGSLALWIGYELWAQDNGRWMTPLFAVLRREELPQDFLVAFLFAINLIGFHAAADWLGPLLAPFARPIRWLAGATFTLYLLHLPISQFLTTVVPWPPTAAATRAVILGGTLALVFVVASVTERRKNAWRRGITRFIAIVFPGKQAA